MAYRRASHGKRASRPAAAFELRLEDHLATLRQELLAGTYRPGRYRSFAIHEPKRRWISAAPFRDRVVHHALCNVIEPLFEAGFVADSFANRVGKGTHRAVTRAQELARAHRYVLPLDLQQFFPSIDHRLLRRRLAARIEDERILGLIDHILASGRGVLDEVYRMVYFPGDDLFAIDRPRGLPIGNLTSQFWANVYLDPLDHFVGEQLGCHGYVRYVDDLLLFGDNKAVLWHWHRALKGALDELRLAAHSGAHPRPTTEGVSFLGFRVFPGQRRLKSRKGFHYRRTLERKLTALGDGTVTSEAVASSVQGWLNHVRFGDTFGLQRELITGLPVEVKRRIVPLPGIWGPGRSTPLTGGALS